MLIRISDRRFAASSQPWIQPGDDPGWSWVDVDQATDEHVGAMPGGEARMLRIAASLLGDTAATCMRPSPAWTVTTCNWSLRRSPTPTAATNTSARRYRTRKAATAPLTEPG